MASGERDLTRGSVWRQVLAYAMPLVASSLLQALYSMVDTVIAGHFAGSAAISAINNSGQILNILTKIAIGITTGGNIIIGQYYGAKEHGRLGEASGTLLSLSLLLGAATAVGLYAGAYPLLGLLGAPAMEQSVAYLRICAVGMVFVFGYNALSAVLRGMGDSLSALGFLLVAAALNVGLDLWFVAGLGTGVAGVALATVLAQTISAFLCLWKLLRMRDVFDLTLHYLKPCSAPIANIIRIGVPSGITQAIFSVAMLVVQSLTNSFGEMVIACNVIVMRVDGFAMMPNFTFGQAMTTYTGQNVGARRLDRVHQGAKQGTWIAVGISAFLTALILLFGRQLMGVFTETAVLVDLSMRMMQILAFGYIAMSITQCLSGVMRGAGDTMTPMWISIITTVVLRVPIAYGIAFFTRSAEYPTGRPESTFISLLVSWSLGALLTAVAYRFGAWRKRLATAEPAPQL